MHEGKAHRGPKWHGTGSADSYVFDRMVRPDSRQSSDDEEDSGGMNDEESFFMPLGESVKFPPLSSDISNMSSKRAQRYRRSRGGTAAAVPWFNGTTPDVRANASHFAFDASTKEEQKRRRDRTLQGRYISPQQAQAQRQEDLRLAREASGGVTLSSLGILSDVSRTGNFANSTNVSRATSKPQRINQGSRLRRDSATSGTSNSLRSIPALPPLPESLLGGTSQGESIQVRAHYVGSTQKFKLPAPSLSQLQSLVAHCFGLGALDLAADSVSDEFAYAKTLRAGSGTSLSSHSRSSSGAGDRAGLGNLAATRDGDASVSHPQAESPTRSVPDDGWFSSRFDLKLSDMAFKLDDDTSLALAVQWARESVTGVLSIIIQPKRDITRLPVLKPYWPAAAQRSKFGQKKPTQEVELLEPLDSPRSDSSNEN